MESGEKSMGHCQCGKLSQRKWTRIAISKNYHGEPNLQAAHHRRKKFLGASLMAFQTWASPDYRGV